MQLHEIKEYYRQITSVDIGEVARELLSSHITENGDSVIHIDCPRHHSTSGKSLHVEVDKQLWRCWGCGISGDVLQLVEFVRHGVVTTGVAGTMTETHRDARNWLADKIGLPKLSHMGLSDEEIKKVEMQEANLQSARRVLTATADWYHARLMENSEMMAWLKKQYAFTEETIVKHNIGFSDINGLRDHLYGLNFTTDELLASGLFRPNEINDERKVLPFFNQRIMFPYLSQGRVTYFIGRKCPVTPEDKWESGKYKKLPTYDPEKKTWIAAGIENNQLFNEDCLLKRPSQVIITEGITDCITLINQGFNCVSPVTTNVRQDDWDRLLPQLRGVKNVVICQDNEISEAGWQGALKTARHLERAGISCRIAVLPLNDEQIAARKVLSEKFKINETVGQKSLQAKLLNNTIEEKEEAKQLLEKAKIDICSYFVSGHTAEDFEQILREAKSSVEYAIATVLTDTSAADRMSQVDDILIQISYQPELEHDRLLRLLQLQLGNEYRLAALRNRLKNCRQAIKNTQIESQKTQAVDIEDDSTFTIGRHRYRITDNGIVRETLRETSQGIVLSAPESLTNFHIKIDQQIYHDDGEIHADGTTISETSMHGEIIGADWRKPFHIKGSEWGSNSDLSRKITASALQQAVFSTRHLDDIRLVTPLMSKDVSSELVYTVFGHHAVAGFVSPTTTICDGEIIPTVSTNTSVDVGIDYNKARILDLQIAPPEEVKSLVQHLLTEYLRLQSYSVTLPIIAHAFLGPILFSHNFLQGYSPYILFITGSSGKGKTETARLAQCLWGKFTSKDKLSGWGSTPESNRQEAARCRGGMWMIDDFKRHKIGKNHWENALRVLTDYADLQSRKRATPGAKVHSGAVIRAMLTVTGEDLPFNETSTLARSLVVNYTGDTKSKELYRKCLNRHHDYNKITTAYIAWWQKQDHDYWRTQLDATLDNFTNFMNAEDLISDNSGRLASNAALSMIGMEAFLDFATSIGCYPQELTGHDLMVEHSVVLKDILRRMVDSVNNARPSESFIGTLVQLLAAGRVRIKDRYIEDHSDHGIPVVGYYSPDRSMVYLLPCLAMGAVREAYKRGEDEPLYFTTQAIGKQLTEEGLLVPEDTKNKIKLRRVRIPGSGRKVNPPNAWRISASNLENMLNHECDKYASVDE
jgi:DNA primase